MQLQVNAFYNFDIRDTGSYVLNIVCYCIELILFDFTAANTLLRNSRWPGHGTSLSPNFSSLTWSKKLL